MNRMYSWLKNTLGFSKMEANGIVILIPLMVLLLFIPAIYRYYSTLDTSNKLDYDRMEKLYQGLKKREVEDSVNRVKEYRAKHKSTWEKYDGRRSSNERKYISKKPHRKSIEVFDLNLADTTRLKEITGIGSVLSNRIVKYRNLLGGFTSKDQLREVYGLKDSVLLALDSLVIVQQDYVPELVAINSQTEAELRKHPYINYKMAKIIAAYRFQHGTFDSIGDLRKVVLMDSITVSKLKPYLKF